MSSNKKPSLSELRDALLKYRAHHTPECSANRNFERECDCGFYELKQRLNLISSEKNNTKNNIKSKKIDLHIGVGFSGAFFLELNNKRIECYDGGVGDTDAWTTVDSKKLLNLLEGCSNKEETNTISAVETLVSAILEAVNGNFHDVDLENVIWAATQFDIDKELIEELEENSTILIPPF